MQFQRGKGRIQLACESLLLPSFSLLKKNVRNNWRKNKTKQTGNRNDCLTRDCK
ncbi:Uncharacterized protein APZ42_027913 [Daphnia magna]|uniref:Uncharacterized protein n=1 Tax=Daphnia magna TaxID=35525 RepID=A0A164QYS8_9CRUS|nr:Uncharacterized protein APZ42_027913 [Daphnia magna]